MRRIENWRSASGQRVEVRLPSGAWVPGRLLCERRRRARMDVELQEDVVARIILPQDAELRWPSED